MTGDDFRDLVLAMEGATEGAHMKHPDFRANGRIFASLTAAEDQGVVKLAPDEQAELVRVHGGTIVPAAGAWGRQGWTTIQLANASAPVVRSAVVLAWQGIMALPAKKTGTRSTRVTSRPSTRKRSTAKRR